MGTMTSLGKMVDCLSQLSIKTRIETQEGFRLDLLNTSVWVSYPLKQGLKLLYRLGYTIFLFGLSQLSIKTRIETISWLH